MRLKKWLYGIGLLLIATGYGALSLTGRVESYQTVVQLAWWGIWLVVLGGGLVFLAMMFFHE